MTKDNGWKAYKDSEYEIIGLSEGLRNEDMCFVMTTPDGQQFNCKTIQDVRNVAKLWEKEKKFYWWYITERMKKVVYMGELQKEHTEKSTGAKLIKI